ncbi:hypothetical protein ACRYI5_08430 [Furfurilactobacillus sp. WILCCON 0119]
MIKAAIIDELNAAIETQDHVQTLNRNVYRAFGYDLSTIYMLLRLQQAADGIEIAVLAKALNISSSALSLRISTNVHLGLISVKNVARDRRTKRVFLTQLGEQATQKFGTQLHHILNKN